ncbi:MAG: hypothetical protein FH748_17030 [Balneolaceae bacterium]|nr:hypothetical protein [Balneolaceae bacterium]
MTMTPNTASTNPKQARTLNQLFAEPLLQRIKKESREEYAEMQEAFDLMGWGGLPDALKIEIYDDVKFMVQELKGYFSSCDPYVERRRKSIHYWISCYQDNICTLDAAVKALKVKSL